MNRAFSTVGWLAVLLFLVSCASDSPDKVTPSEDAPTPEATAGTLTIFAPTGGNLVLNGLKVVLKAAGLPYEIIVMEGIATDLVIEGLYDDTFDLVFMHRRPRSDEGLEFFGLVQSNVAIYTHPEIVIDNLTSEEIVAIFCGEITNWSQVGAHDQEIVLFTLPETDSITESLRYEILGNQPFSEAVHIFPDEISVMLSATSIPGAISYTTLATKKYIELIDSDKTDQDFNVVSIDGLMPDDPYYPISIVIGFGYLPENQAFLQPLFDWFTEFLNTPQGKQVLTLFSVQPVSGR